MKNKRILIIGDSTGYAVRPIGGDNYHRLLLNDGYQVDSKCRNSIVVDDLLKELDLIISMSYDWVILAIGINDISPRPYKYSLFRKINLNHYYREKVLSLKEVFFKINHLFNKYVAPLLIKMLSLEGNNRPIEFTSKLFCLIEQLQMETKAKIIIFTLPYTNKKLEKYLPKINKLIEETNLLLRQYSNGDVYIIDINAIIIHNGGNELLIDGFHFPENIHKEIFTEIKRLVGENNGN